MEKLQAIVKKVKTESPTIKRIYFLLDNDWKLEYTAGQYITVFIDGSKVTEGSSVSINYVTGSSKRIQTMSLPKRAIYPGSKILIIDDFMKAGGTAKGMIDLACEVGGVVVGIGVLVATATPEPKLVDDYSALLTLHEVDEQSRNVVIQPVLD